MQNDLNSRLVVIGHEEIKRLNEELAEANAKIQLLNQRLWVEKARTEFLLGTKARLTGELKAKNFALGVWRDNAVQQANGQ